MSLAEAIARSLRDGGGAEAVEHAHGVASWRDLAEAAAAVDGALSLAGLGPGAIIGLPGRNRLAPAAAFLGLLGSSRCAAMINPFQPLDRVAADAETAKARAVILEEEDLALGELSGDFGVYVWAGGALRQHRAPAPNGAASETLPALVMATSGTTGAPKRIEIAARTLDRALREIIGFNQGFGDLDRPGPELPALIQYSPLAHIAGALTLSRAAAQQRTVALLEKFEPHVWADIVRRRRPRTTGLPPAMMKMALEAALPAGDLESLVSVWSGSAPVDPKVETVFSQRYGLPVLGNYGATEFCGAVATWSLEDHARLALEKSGAVGRILPAVAEARVRSQDGEELLAPGEIGALELKVHRVGDAWLVTIDLAHLDADGFLYLHGRADDAINRGGFKIAPAAVAEALMSHPGVAEALVVGLDDPRLGQVPVAVVVPRKGAPPVNERELIAHVKQRLPAYCAPTAVKFVEAAPRTPAMKIDRRAVRALFRESSEAD